MTGSRRVPRAAPAFALAATMALALASSSLAAIHVELASRNSDGEPATGDSEGGVLSPDGNLEVFYSASDNLPGGDGSTYQVYVRNFEQGETELVSVNDHGDPADDEVFGTSISANGRFVVLEGIAGNLPGGDGRSSQVWIHDREAGTTQLVSRANNGDPADEGGYSASVSANGRFVAFHSYADNLPGGDGSEPFVYVRDLKEGKTRLASKTNHGDPASGQYGSLAISSSGRWVAFQSRDPDLPGGDGHTDHVYLRNLERHRTTLIDRAADGRVANEDSRYPSVSANGRFVVFDSYADNLPGGGEDHTQLYRRHTQVYRRDLERGRTRLVSRTGAGAPQNGRAYYGSVSGGGRYVVFTADSTNLPGGYRGRAQAYVRDLRERRTRLLSKDPNGEPAHSAYATSISRDGHWAAFFSNALKLGGSGGHYNVFRAGPIG